MLALDRNKEDSCLQNDLTWKHYPSVKQVNQKTLSIYLNRERKSYV